MPKCLKCGAELPVDEEGGAPVLCDNCAGRATRRARVGMSSSTFRDSPATTLLTGINIAVFAGMILSGGASGMFSQFSPELSQQWGANVGPLTLSGEYWRLVTAGFVHANLMHIAFNMWCLWSLGQLCERLFGSWVTFAVYILTGVGGSLLSVGWNPLRGEVGASGAVFGIAGAIISGIKFGNVSVSSIQRRSIFSSLVFFVGFNLFIGFALPGVDNMCHLGGLISGLIFGAPLATAAASGKRSVEWLTIVIAALALAGIGAQVVHARAPQARAALITQSLREANDAINDGDFARAISILELEASANPRNAQAHAMLGYSYEMTNQREKAIAAYERALAIAPDFKPVKSRLDALQSSTPQDNK
jgi:rhomboid protease GluP